MNAGDGPLRAPHATAITVLTGLSRGFAQASTPVFPFLRMSSPPSWGHHLDVLVPVEMLGVSAGLGYFILDTRDRLAYSELTAAILLIGALGYLLDHLARWLHAQRGPRRAA